MNTVQTITADSGTAKRSALGLDKVGNNFTTDLTPDKRRKNIMQNITQELFSNTARRVAQGLCLSLALVAAGAQANTDMLSIAGEAKDIAAGADGSVWRIGTDKGIFKRDAATNTWTRTATGSGVRITVDSAGIPWVVSENGGIYKSTDTQGSWWTHIPGKTAADIAAGKNGAVWIISRETVYTDVGANNKIYKWDGNVFSLKHGTGVQIDVDSSGRPWVTNGQGEIWRATDDQATSWTKLSGTARTITIGADGSVWKIGTDRVLAEVENYDIWKRNSNDSWTKRPGHALYFLAVDTDGNPWGADWLDRVWTYGDYKKAYGGLNILTYNVQLNYPDSSNDVSRSKQIAAYLKGAPATSTNDVIVLNEMFNDMNPDKVRSELMKALKPNYPYQTPVIAAAADQDKWDEHSGANARWAVKNSGGVTILSQHPILKQIKHLYGIYCGADANTNKGLAHAKISYNGYVAHVIGTHTQSDVPTEVLCTSKEWRFKQFKQIKDYIDYHVPVNEPVFIAGDLNSPKGSAEYQPMLNTLSVYEPVYNSPHIDSWNPKQNAILKDSKYSSDPPHHYDYILQFKNEVPTLNLRNRTIFDDKTKVMSDHFPVVGGVDAQM